MKAKGACADFKKERSGDLYRAYIRYLADCRYVSPEKIYHAVANMPAKRFWVSPERAAIVVARISRGEKLLEMRPTKRRMFFAIHNRVSRLKKKYPSRSLAQLCSNVIYTPAPEFYLAPGTVKLLICQAKRGVYEKRH